MDKDKEVHSIIKGGTLEECIEYIDGVYKYDIEEKLK